MGQTLAEIVLRQPREQDLARPGANPRSDDATPSVRLTEDPARNLAAPSDLRAWGSFGRDNRPGRAYSSRVRPSTRIPVQVSPDRLSHSSYMCQSRSADGAAAAVASPSAHWRAASRATWRRSTRALEVGRLLGRTSAQPPPDARLGRGGGARPRPRLVAAVAPRPPTRPAFATGSSPITADNLLRLHDHGALGLKLPASQEPKPVIFGTREGSER